MNAVGVGIPELAGAFFIALMALAVVWPAGRICRRLGFPWALGVLAIIPAVNLLLLWFVALSRWPSSDTSRTGA